MYQNLSQLAALTGFSKETVGKRLAEAEILPLPESPGNAKLFDSVVALPAIFGATPSGQTELVRERARVSRATAEKKERELLLDKRHLLRADEVHHLIASSMTVIRDFCTALPGHIELTMEQYGVRPEPGLLDAIERSIDGARHVAADKMLEFGKTLPPPLS